MQTNLIDFGFAGLMRSMAATALFPVATMGSATMMSRSAISFGIL